MLSCVITGNSATTSCSETDICFQPNKSEDYSLLTEVSAFIFLFVSLLDCFAQLMVVWQNISVNMKPSFTWSNEHCFDCVAIVPCAELTVSWTDRQTDRQTGEWYQSCCLTQCSQSVESFKHQDICKLMTLFSQGVVYLCLPFVTF